MTQEVYKNQVLKVLNINVDTDTLNLTDDKPELLFGPKIEGKYQEAVMPPFYVSLNIHDKILHNAMLDSGASHNLMPKVIMESLGLEITRPYKDLYSFYSRRVKCLGLVKYLCVNLSQIPTKNIVMDVVVADIPQKYGMLLSRSWGAKIQGTLQMDMSYATIPVFGQTRRLYRETLMKYMVSSTDKPHNTPIYSTRSDLDSFILYNEYEVTQTKEENRQDISAPDHSQPFSPQPLDTLTPSSLEQHKTNENETETLWRMSFDGSCSKNSAGAGVWIHNTNQGHAYRLDFSCTNNIAEYEALLLGLHILKDLKAKKISVQGDSELIIRKIKGEYSTKNPRLR